MNTATATHTIKLKNNGSDQQPGYFTRRGVWDWLFAALVVAGAAVACVRYGASMDFYETAILAGAVPSLIWLGWFWRPLRALSVSVAAVSLLAIWLHQTPAMARI